MLCDTFRSVEVYAIVLLSCLAPAEGYSAVGRTVGSATVSSTGAAIYSIPLVLR